jgi:hypothetical protein
MTLWIIGTVVCVLTLGIITAHRTSEVVRYSSFAFCATNIVGCLLGLSSIFPMSFDPTAIGCSYSLFALTIGFSLLYGCVDLASLSICSLE